MKFKLKEGLRIARLMMVLSSLSPLFLLWAIRGNKATPDWLLWILCAGFVIIPNFFLWWRIHTAKNPKERDMKTIVVENADDHREHLLVYLFATLIPLYDANIGNGRDFAATLAALIFIVFLFWHLNLHYMNIFFAIIGYHVFTISPRKDEQSIQGMIPIVLLTKRPYLKEGTKLDTFRISNTVFIES
jgi:hypothetical protein